MLASRTCSSLHSHHPPALHLCNPAAAVRPSAVRCRKHKDRLLNLQQAPCACTALSLLGTCLCRVIPVEQSSAGRQVWGCAQGCCK